MIKRGHHPPKKATGEIRILDELFDLAAQHPPESKAYFIHAKQCDGPLFRLFVGRSWRSAAKLAVSGSSSTTAFQWFDDWTVSILFGLNRTNAIDSINLTFNRPASVKIVDAHCVPSIRFEELQRNDPVPAQLSFQRPGIRSTMATTSLMTAPSRRNSAQWRTWTG